MKAKREPMRSTLIEPCPDSGTVMKTIREEHGIRYQVLAPEGNVVWEKFVRFGRGKVAGIGGTDFRLAAKEQERVAGKAALRKKEED